MLLSRRLAVLGAVGCVVTASACGFTTAESASDASGPPSDLAVPLVATDPVGEDADDPAIWLNAADLGRTLIIGTNKAAAPAGALVVFGLDGKIRQTIRGLDRPNNVDVEYGWAPLGGPPQDIVVVAERLKHQLRIYRVADATAPLIEIGVVPVLSGESAEASEPMGVGLYRRPRDGAVFAIVAPKLGGAEDYLWQYRLDLDARGQVSGELVRRFGYFSERGAEPGDPGEIEAVVVDDELGYVYFADERFGIRKWHADPDHKDAHRELTVFGRNDYELDREGLALYHGVDGTGYVVSVDQIPGRSALKFYARSGVDDDVHNQSQLLHNTRTAADGTDGLDVTSTPLPGFPLGLVVVMNSSGRNFLLFDWAAVAPSMPLHLTKANEVVPGR